MAAIPNGVSTPTSRDVTGLLRAWGNGERGALERLTPIVYEELRRLARRYLRGERTSHSLQATALVNETYVRVEETAEVLKVSPVTVMRDWNTAKAWLHRELTSRTTDEFRAMETNR